jgi:MFS family permease
MTQKSPQRLSVTKEQLAESGRVVGLGPMQTDRMWDDLVARVTASPAPAAGNGFSAAHLLYYFGAAVVIVAMGWLMALIGTFYGSGAIVFTALIYAGLFAYGGWSLASQRELRVPGGLLYMLAVSMTPIAVAAAMESTRWDTGMALAIPMLATAAVGVVVTRLTRISFVLLPALLGGWLGAIGGAEWLFVHDAPSWEVISIAYGALVAFAGFVMDGKSDEDYSFWAYGIGSLAAFVGLTILNKSDLAYALYAAGGVASMFVSVLLSRRAFAFTGAAAVLVWIFHLSAMFFSNTLLFPVVLVALGVATIYGGVVYHRNSEKIEAAVLRAVPEGLRRMLPRN